MRNRRIIDGERTLLGSERNKKTERHRITKSNDIRFNIRQIFFSFKDKTECKSLITRNHLKLAKKFRMERGVENGFERRFFSLRDDFI